MHKSLTVHVFMYNNNNNCDYSKDGFVNDMSMQLSLRRPLTITFSPLETVMS